MEVIDFFNRQQAIISAEQQEKLSLSHVLVAGVGGLGSPVCQQLVRLGVGNLHIVDRGILDPPDLNRQVLYTTADLGKAKVAVAAPALEQIGMGTRVFPYQVTIDATFELPEEIDYVIDCLDNFEARYFLDDAVQKRGIPMVHGGIHGMFGQLTTILPGQTQSLRSLFGDMVPDLKGKIPVMAPIPSLIASFQVTEFVKLFCQLDHTLVGRLIRIDLTDYSFELTEID